MIRVILSISNHQVVSGISSEATRILQISSASEGSTWEKRIRKE